MSENTETAQVKTVQDNEPPRESSQLTVDMVIQKHLGTNSFTQSAPGIVTNTEKSPEYAPPLTNSVSDLSQVVGELTSQVVHLIKVNQALEADIAAIENSKADDDEQCKKLSDKLKRMEEDSSSLQDMRSELEQLRRERNALTGRVNDLDQALTASEQRLVELGRLLDKFRAERNDANAEAACVDSQLARAIKVIEEQRYDLAARQHTIDDQESQIELMQKQLKRAVNQRNNFQIELKESQSALEEVHRSIIEAGEEAKTRVHRPHHLSSKSRI